MLSLYAPQYPPIGTFQPLNVELKHHTHRGGGGGGGGGAPPPPAPPTNATPHRTGTYGAEHSTTGRTGQQTRPVPVVVR